MKKLTILIVLLLLSIFQAEAQCLQITSFGLDKGDWTAKQEATGKKDINGNLCGLIRIQFAGGNMAFESRSVREVEISPNGYLVWMAPNAANLTIKVPGYFPFKVDFKEKLGLEKGIQSGNTYVMVIEDPQYSTRRTTANEGKEQTIGQTAEEYIEKGDYYYYGRNGITKDYTEAVKWYRKAADQGYALAQYYLGYCYDNGQGVTQDYAEAIKWYRKAADQGNDKAQTNLAYCYEAGNGVTQDYTEAVKWYRKAVVQGNARAQNNLGFCYDKGYGVKQDYAEAFKLYLKAAEQGNVRAQGNLGFCYEYGQGVTQDYAEAIKWYRKAAEQGDVKAQTNLGYCYEFGKGVMQDYTEAVKWYCKAAEQGNATAQNNLGVCYKNGHGVMQDYTEAVKWYRKAADQGFALAQNDLGVFYENGDGVTQDYAEAVKWYRKAAEQGNADAQNNLGLCYEDGKGVPQDNQIAMTWYQKALDQNPDLTEAKNNLARIEKIIAEQTNNNNNYAQNTITTTQPKVEPKPKMEPKVEMVMVDTDIPIISRVNRNTFAIIIANEDYMDEAKVDFAKNDGEVFKSYCRKTLGLPETNIHYLPNATLAKMFGELDWLRQVCEVYKGEANVIFYYSGHGFPDEKSHEAYIIPVDGNKRLLRTCFNVSELYETLGSMPSKRVTVLMDACFSGAKRSGDMLASAKGIAIKAKAGIPKGNMVVMSAAQGDETAYFHQEAKHGLFTYYLLKKLKETKGSVTLGELSSYIQDEVSKYSIVVNGKIQTPTVQASDRLTGSWQSLNF